MSWRITRSAMSSCSVGSLLMITSLAPQFFAISGNPAAGHTTSDDPIARNRSQCLRQFRGAAHLVFRHRLAERDRRGLHRLVAGRAVGRAAVFVEARLHPGKIVGLPAADAAGIGGVAVKFDDVIGLEARHLMQIVDVLGDDRGNLAGPVERGQRAMPAPGLCRRKGRLHRKAPPPRLVARVRLATNSSNGIGRLRVHIPPGERKSGMPHSVEMPAPVKGTMMEASAIMSPSRSTPLRRSFAITGQSVILGRADYSTPLAVASSLRRRPNGQT